MYVCIHILEGRGYRILCRWRQLSEWRSNENDYHQLYSMKNALLIQSK